MHADLHYQQQTSFWGEFKPKMQKMHVISFHFPAYKSEQLLIAFENAEYLATHTILVLDNSIWKLNSGTVLSHCWQWDLLNVKGFYFIERYIYTFVAYMYWESTFIMVQYYYVKVIKVWGFFCVTVFFVTENWSRKWNQVTSCICDFNNNKKIKKVLKKSNRNKRHSQISTIHKNL